MKKIIITQMQLPLDQINERKEIVLMNRMITSNKMEIWPIDYQDL